MNWKFKLEKQKFHITLKTRFHSEEENTFYWGKEFLFIDSNPSEFLNSYEHINVILFCLPFMKSAQIDFAINLNSTLCVPKIVTKLGGGDFIMRNEKVQMALKTQKKI